MHRIIIGLFILTLCTGCATGGSAYWIPPAGPTPQPVSPIMALPTAVELPSPTALPRYLPSATPRSSATPPPPLYTPWPIEAATPFISNLGATAAAVAAEATWTPLAPSATPLLAGLPSATPGVSVVDTAPVLYYAQAADTLHGIAVRFGVRAEEITSPENLPPEAFINPGQLLIIPRRLSNVTSAQQLLPDSEFVYSPSAVSFNTVSFVNGTTGYLSSYKEWHKSTGMRTGAQIVERVAIENSVNPRLLLALLEFHGGWIYGQPGTQDRLDYPMGLKLPPAKGLYNQLVWAVNQLSTGYYAYREGRLTEIKFTDGVTARLAPDLNAGTAALQYYFAKHYSSSEWVAALNPQTGLPALHAAMFGDIWARARTVEPLFPPGIQQPPFVLPINRNWTWAYTGGPHGAWEQEGAYAALDFAPGAKTSGCLESTPAFAVAAAAGLVVRTGPGLVVIDTDGDGYEQTGWVLVYLHIAEKERVKQGAWVAQGDMIGRPSCEGGFATGTHLHIARKYNGEWVPAAGPLAFNLGGWVAKAGLLPYLGTLTRDGVTLTACTCSNYMTFVTRTESDP